MIDDSDCIYIPWKLNFLFFSFSKFRITSVDIFVSLQPQQMKPVDRCFENLFRQVQHLKCSVPGYLIVVQCLQWEYGVFFCQHIWYQIFIEKKERKKQHNNILQRTLLLHRESNNQSRGLTSQVCILKPHKSEIVIPTNKK